MTVQVTIPPRFNGPPTSGNGGYSCGLLALQINGPARVRLHHPPPLDTPLELKRQGDGRMEMLDGTQLVGTAEPSQLELEVPPAPTLAQAEKAREGFPCYEKHVFGTCFVCGPSRPAHDGLELFPGPVADWQLIACPWTVGEDMLDTAGAIRGEIVWSALDCPGYFAAMGGESKHAVLGELHGEIVRPIEGTDSLVVFAWPLGKDGRKHYGATAIATADGEVVARSRATWIEMKG